MIPSPSPDSSDPAADPIGAFYTRHPYPPPVENLDRARDDAGDALRHRAEHHLIWPHLPYRPDIDILVAGCGTWQAAKYAIAHPAARVVGIDVSLTSIDATAALKAKYALDNLELRQLPIERAGELERRFDLVICTGVLHHLADPARGLRTLRDTLRADGAIYLMVYAPFGRAGIYMLQEYCRHLGIGTSSADIRDLVATLEALPPAHPAAAVLRAARDGDTDDALADALLNPRDQAYAVPRLLKLLADCGVAFRRWYWQAPYLSRCGAIAGTPHAPRLADLPPSAQYAAMELFRGTMTTHSLVAGRDDAPAGTAVSFDGEAWPGFVPLRRPWTRAIQERLPPGAAAVLLNRSHQHHDLVLPVSAAQMRLIDRIDGARPIARIAADAGVDVARTRGLFETLSAYDQVVFDVSGA